MSVLERLHKSTAAVLLIMGAVILLLPSVVFVLVALAKGMGTETIAALVEQYSSERHNLRSVSLVGMLPWLLLAALVGIRWRFVRRERRPLYAFSGALPILLVTAFVNYEFWSLYLPSRAFLGFPHGIELVIGPLFFAPIGLAIGLAVGWAVMRTRP